MVLVWKGVAYPSFGVRRNDVRRRFQMIPINRFHRCALSCPVPKRHSSGKPTLYSLQGVESCSFSYNSLLQETRQQNNRTSPVSIRISEFSQSRLDFFLHSLHKTSTHLSLHSTFLVPLSNSSELGVHRQVCVFLKREQAGRRTLLARGLERAWWYVVYAPVYFFLFPVFTPRTPERLSFRFSSLRPKHHPVALLLCCRPQRVHTV